MLAIASATLRITPMHVHQLSISYLPEQDRILVRVNTSENKELQFWFTRRLALGLMPLLDRISTERAAHRGGLATAHMAPADPLAKKAMAEFQRNETLRSADFSTPYQTPPAGEPLFGGPLLITEIKIASMAGGQLRLNCTEKLADKPEQRKFELALSDALTHAFMHLLERAIASSQWRSAGAVGAAPATTAAPESKPSYLN